MAKRICIQPGHINGKFNSIVALRGSTGAPGEQEFTLDVANKVSEQLRARGFEVKQTDANANDDPAVTKTDWDLYLAIHYDADVYNDNGFFVDYPEPSTDGATNESQRLAQSLRDSYGSETGIPRHDERSNKNTRYYYMWRYLTSKTPCVLIECGVGNRKPNDYDQLHGDNRAKVVSGIVRGICAAFGVAYDLNPATPPQPATSNITTDITVGAPTPSGDGLDMGITVTVKSDGSVVDTSQRTAHIIVDIRTQDDKDNAEFVAKYKKLIDGIIAAK
jgi:N-acetylmuramoyl-L-alanine amidase